MSLLNVQESQRLLRVFTSWGMAGFFIATGWDMVHLLLTRLS